MREDTTSTMEIFMAYDPKMKFMASKPHLAVDKESEGDSHAEVA